MKTLQDNTASTTLQSAIRNKLTLNTLIHLCSSRDGQNICSLNNFDPYVDIMLNDVFHIGINSAPDIYTEDADNHYTLKKDTNEYLKKNL